MVKFCQAAGLRAIDGAICLTVAGQAVVEEGIHDYCLEVGSVCSIISMSW